MHFSTRDVSRKIVKKIEKSTRKKNLLKFHFCISQHSKQTYIGNFVYQGVALNTLGNNGLNKSLGNNGLRRSMQKSNCVCTEKRAER